MNIFIRELQANLKSLIIWSIIAVIFCVSAFTEFSAYYDNPELLEVLNSIPPVMLEAFQLNAFNLTTVSGYVAVMQTYFAILLGVSASLWGSDIIIKEERDKTVEFLLTMPVTRMRLVMAKTLAAAFKCLVLTLVIWATIVLGTAKYEPDADFYTFLGLSMLALFMVQMIFLSVSIFLGCAMKRHKRVGSTAIAILLGAYFLSLLTDINENLEFLQYFSPFKYFNPVLLLNESRFEAEFVLLSMAIVLVAMVGAHITYERRDLYI